MDKNRKSGNIVANMPLRLPDERFLTALLTRPIGPPSEGNTVSFTIPGNPVAKGRHRNGRTFRNKLGQQRRINYTPKNTAVAEALVQSIANRAMGGRPLLTGAVELHVKAVLPIPTSWSVKRQADAAAGRILPAKKPDLSNVIKLLEDGCNTVVWRDDAQITDMSLSKRYGLVPQVEATIKPKAAE